MTDKEKEYWLSEMEPIKRNVPPPAFIIDYMTIDGKKFTNKSQAIMHDEEISRKAFYDHLLKNRNWLEKLFNIKPSMEYYDRLTFTAKFQIPKTWSNGK